MKYTKIFSCALALAAGLPAVELKNSVTVELLNGHLGTWETRWQEGSLPEVRLWGRENGAVSGSLAVGPFLVGPLKPQQRSGRLWHFAPAASAQPGTWGAFVGRDAPASAWFLQTPERVGAGAQLQVSLDLWTAAAGWQRTWPGGDEGRFLVEAGGKVFSATVQSTVVSEPLVPPAWGNDARAQAKTDDGEASVRWKNDPGKSGALEIKGRWGDANAGLLVPFDSPEKATGNAGGRFVVGTLVVASATRKNSSGWVQDLSLDGKLPGGTWQLESSWPWGAGDWSLSPRVSLRTDDSSRWSLKVTWKGPVGQEPGAVLEAQWQGGGWSATLGLEAPHLDAQWFGTDNQTQLTLKHVF